MSSTATITRHKPITFSEKMNSHELLEACGALLADPRNIVANGRALINVASQVGSIPFRSAESFLAALDVPNSRLTWDGAANYIESVARGLPGFVASIEAFERANQSEHFFQSPINIAACRLDHRLLQKSLERVKELAPEAIQGKTW